MSLTKRRQPTVWQASVSTCFTRSFAYRSDDSSIQDDYPLTLLLTPPTDDSWRRTSDIRLGSYSIEIDHQRRSLHHRGRHADPLFPVQTEQGGTTTFEINLYDIGLEDIRNAGIELVMASGEICRVAPQMMAEQADPDRLDSHIDWLPSRPVLHVTLAQPGELVWQVLRFGRFSEQRQLLEAGQHAIAIPPAFADWYGISISSEAIYGAIEHKHMLLGQLGIGAGRWLYLSRQDLLLPPPMAGADRYRALVVVVDPVEPAAVTARKLEHLSTAWHELDIWAADTARIDEIRNLTSSVDQQRLHFNIGAVTNQEGLRPGCNSDAPGFVKQLLLALDAGKSGHADPWLRQWSGARLDRSYMPDHGHHGIGYCASIDQLSAATADVAARLATADRFERRRHLLHSIPCSGCAAETKAACRNILPRPFDYQRLFQAEGCRLMKTLENAAHRPSDSKSHPS